ncbi:MAG: WD40/YVTN/BNR-like repeat-containing protein, partial [Flavobacteriales bacterium]
GRGIYKSLDAGETWSFMGLEDTKNIHRILVHPRDPNTVFVAATGSAWGDSEARGVYKTTDGGLTWDHILSVNERT